MEKQYQQMIKEYQTEIVKYERQVQDLVAKNKTKLAKIDQINAKLEMVSKARSNALLAEQKYKKQSVETNSRYQALLERTMQLIEEDSRKNVQLQVLSTDNVRLAKGVQLQIREQKLGKNGINGIKNISKDSLEKIQRHNSLQLESEITKPETEKILKFANKNARLANRKRVVSAKKSVLAASSKLKTQEDIQKFGFLAEQVPMNMKIEVYRPSTVGGDLWDESRRIKGPVRQGFMRGVAGMPGMDRRIENI